MRTASKQLMYMYENPDSTFEEFEKATGGTKQQWYSCRQGVRRRQATLLAKKAKAREIARLAKLAKESLAERKKSINLGVVEGHLSAKNDDVHLLNKRIAQLEGEIHGYKTIIKYLENQVGLKQSAAPI